MPAEISWAVISRIRSTVSSSRLSHSNRLSRSRLPLRRQAVQPQAVAVSCGLNNDYGHPHREALQNFADVGAAIYRTDEQGSLTFIWQGNALTVQTTADTADLAA